MAQRKQRQRKATLKDASTFHRRDDVRTRQLGFDLAIFDPETELLHWLNPVGAAVWQHITPDRTVKNIAEVIFLVHFREEERLGEVKHDVIRLLSQLESRGLIYREGARPPKRRRKARKVQVRIPDGEIGPAPRGYERPNLRSFTLEDLQERFRLDRDVVAPFSDLGDEWPR